MPLFKTINHNNHALIYVWKITEKLDFLSDINLINNSLIQLKRFKSEQQKKGFLSVRRLLNIAGYTDHDLFYLESGKPCLKDSKHISISHTQAYATIIISEFPVGIDVEKHRTQLFKIKHKFLNAEELAWLSEKESLEMLTKLWCCKEALYKIYPHNGLALKNIMINDFEINDQQTTGSIIEKDWKKNYQINFDFFEDHILAYATEK